MGRAVRILAALAALILGLGLLALLLAPVFIERTLRAELAERGIDAIQMDLSTPGLGGMTARQVRIGRDEVFAADEVAVVYRIAELMHGRIERIRLVRPRLSIAASDEGQVSLGSLDALIGGEPGGAAGGFALPAPIEIIDGTIIAATPAGEVTVRLDGSVTLEPGAGPLKLAITGPWLTAELAVTLSQNGSDLALSGRVIEARIAHPLLSATAQGRFTAAFGTDDPNVSAELTLSDVQSPHLSIGSGPASGDLSVWFEPGRLAGDLRLHGPGGRFEASVLGDPARIPRVTLAGDHLSIPQTLSEASFNAAFDLYPSGRRALLVEPARIDARLAPELRASLPEALRSAVVDAPLRITAEPGLRVSQTDAGLTVGGRISLTQQESLAVVLDGWFTQAASGLDSRVEARVELAKFTLAGATLRKLSLTAPLQLVMKDGRMQIRLTGPAPLSVAVIELGSTRLTKVALTAQPVERPLFTLGPEGLAFALSVKAGKTSGRLGQSREPFTLAWQGATFQGNPRIPLTAEVSGGRVVLSRLGWEADGIAAQLTADEAASAALELRLAIARLAQSGEAPALAPLAIEGTVHPTDTLVRFDLRGRDITGKVQLALKGSHDLGRNRGSATLALDPLRFLPGGLQPAAVVPRLGTILRDATGTLSTGGKLAWSDKGLTSDLELAIERLSFLSPFGSVLGLDGRVRLNSLAPLATPPGQRITAAAIQAALPMSDLALQFGLREGRYFEVEDGGLALADGRVTIVPVTLDLEAERNTLRLQVADVKLPILFDLIGLDGLTGTGRLAGEIPFALQDRDVAIESGRLESQEAGQIRYDPAKPPSALQGGGESVGMALAALRNFHYDRLTLDLDRKIGGETQVGLHIAGKNPDFYGGYPVEFNLNLSGKLDQILVQGLAGYRIPDTLQDTLKQSPGGSGPSAP